MKNNIFPIVLVFCLFVTFFSCSSKSKRSRKPVSSISVIPDQKDYKFGQAVDITVKTKLPNGEIEKVQLFYEDNLMSTEKSLEFSFKINSLNKIGTNQIKVVSTKTDGVSNSRVKNFSVLSDIEPQKYSYKIVGEYPHSTSFFTEGLILCNGFLYEGTGQNGTSSIYKTDYKTGKILQQHKLDDFYFGEGITVLNNKVYQLTYKEKTGFVYNLPDLSPVDSFKISSAEGWGLTNDGKSLIMSDGTNRLTWINPENYSVTKTLYVASNKEHINYVNELEYIDGHIFANVWMKNIIIEIDPKTGKVISETDLNGLTKKLNTNLSNIDVMNGIAYNNNKNTLLVTGKMWPKLFEIKLEKSE